MVSGHLYYVCSVSGYQDIRIAFKKDIYALSHYGSTYYLMSIHKPVEYVVIAVALICECE